MVSLTNSLIGYILVAHPAEVMVFIQVNNDPILWLAFCLIPLGYALYSINARETERSMQRLKHGIDEFKELENLLRIEHQRSQRRQEVADKPDDSSPRNTH